MQFESYKERGRRVYTQKKEGREKCLYKKEWLKQQKEKENGRLDLLGKRSTTTNKERQQERKPNHRRQHNEQHSERLCISMYNLHSQPLWQRMDRVHILDHIEFFQDRLVRLGK